MSYDSLDLRSTIRSQIGYTRYVDRVDRSTVSVDDDRGDKVFVPLLLPGEVRTGDLPNMPFIEMVLVSSPASVANIGGDVREQDCYIDFNIYYTNTDHITPSIFGKTIADEIIDKITENRSSITGSYFVEIVNDGREIIEVEEGKSVIFHRVLECHIKNYS